MNFKRMLPILGALFIVGYVPTAAIYTTRFFLHHAPIDTNFTIFGFSAVSILPISAAVLLCTMELFAFRLAVIFWNALDTSTRRAAISFVLFGVLQILPFTSTYLGTRGVAYEQFVLHEQGRVREADAASTREDARRTVDAGVRADDLARLQRLRADIAAEIKEANNETARLRSSRRAALPAIAAELLRLEEVLKSQTKLRNDIDDQLIKRSATTAEATKVEPPIEIPLFTDFLADRFWSFEALMSLMVSLVFPLAAFAYGFISTKGIEQASMPVFDLTRELEIGAGRPLGEHMAFAELLKSAVTAYAIAHRTGGNLADEAVILRMRDDRAIELIEMFTHLKDQITESNLSAEAKKELITHIDELQAQGLHRKHKEAA